MKLISIIIKTLKEQWRSFWILLLTLSMGPFFIFVYYLIIESSKPHYEIAIVNNDIGYINDSLSVNKGEDFLLFLTSVVKDLSNMPFYVRKITTKADALDELKNKKTDALVIIPEDFSFRLSDNQNGKTSTAGIIEFFGDLTNVRYLISALWANESLNSFIKENSRSEDLIKVKETGDG